MTRTSSVPEPRIFAILAFQALSPRRFLLSRPGQVLRRASRHSHSERALESCRSPSDCRRRQQRVCFLEVSTVWRCLCDRAAGFSRWDKWWNRLRSQVQLETERQELAGSYQTAATLILDAVSNWLTTLEKI